MRKLLVLALLISAPAAAVDSCASPIAVAKQLRASSEYFQYAKASPRPLLTEKFFKAVAGGVRCSEVHDDTCNLDYDPWLGAQDGKMVGTPEFSVVSGDLEYEAIVQMRYRYVIGGKKPIYHAVELVMRKRASGCWEVDDLITPVGDSLLHLFSLPIDQKPTPPPS